LRLYTKEEGDVAIPLHRRALRRLVARRRGRRCRGCIGYRQIVIGGRSLGGWRIRRSRSGVDSRRGIAGRCLNRHRQIAWRIALQRIERIKHAGRGRFAVGGRRPIERFEASLGDAKRKRRVWEQLKAVRAEGPVY